MNETGMDYPFHSSSFAYHNPGLLQADPGEPEPVLIAGHGRAKLHFGHNAFVEQHHCMV
jgi:hypothetical protein